MDKRIPLTLTPATPAAATSMYVSERKIHPRDIDGRFQRLRRVAVWVLLGMFYAFPWLRWDGRQAVLFDLPARKFHVFGFHFWPQDFVFLAGLLIIAGLSLFFFTALAGRLWCGYACPQTVWTEVFLWIERKLEGDRAKRIRLDAGAWSREKLLRRGGKHAVWLLFALWTGFTFVGFFTPIRELAAQAPPLGRWSGWETFWIFFYALATWGNAGFLREQVCKYMCPYARFQSAMFDRDTLVIAYDAMRGEPRGARRRGLGSVLARARGLLDKALAYDYVFRAAHHPTAADDAVAARGNTAIADPGLRAEPLPAFAPEDLGDCIDCTICVQVCPTGIDIRNGLQYECIACGACVDACNGVMDKLGYPRGLIRYATQNAIDGKPSRVLRPRVVVYGILLLALLLGWSWGIVHRDTLIADVLRDRNALYRSVPGGSENDYTLKLVNKSERARTLRVRLLGADGAAAAGLALTRADADGAVTVPMAPEQVLSLPLTVRADARVRGRRDVLFVLEETAADRSDKSVPTSYFGPAP
jgi:polyferredoxin